jgi:dynein heavy chain
MIILRMLLDEQDDIPWDALLFVSGHINYGGRVTDDWDRRCLISMLKKFYTLEILNDDYTFSSSGIYYAPKNGDLESYRKYIDGLPLKDAPEIFGMHENANITYQMQESEKIVSTVLSIQPRISSSEAGKTPDEIVIEKAIELKEGLPEKLNRDMGLKDMFKLNKEGLLPSLSTVLLQEMQKFNKLLTVMASTLVDLQDAINGIIVMSQELDTMYLSFTNGLVPPNWEEVAYPSLKPLASWYRDLCKRVEFMREWVVNGEPNSFWLSGFFFPQGFMTG